MKRKPPEYNKRYKRNASTSSGVCFTILWDRFKAHLEKRNGGRLGEIVSMRVDKKGIHVFTEDGDATAWSPEI